MADISSPDQVAGYLAAVQERWDVAAHATWQDYATALELLAKALRSVEDVPRLLAAVEAALIRHQGSVDYDYPQEGRFCAPCGEWWPCQEYQDITRALLGEEVLDITGHPAGKVRAKVQEVLAGYASAGGAGGAASPAPEPERAHDFPAGLVDLAVMLSDLDGFIERRATELAAPAIEEAERWRGRTDRERPGI